MWITGVPVEGVQCVELWTNCVLCFSCYVSRVATPVMLRIKQKQTLLPLRGNYCSPHVLTLRATGGGDIGRHETFRIPVIDLINFSLESHHFLFIFLSVFLTTCKQTGHKTIFVCKTSV